MEDHLKQALEIVKAQAGVRNMTEDEISSMLQKLAAGIRSIVANQPEEEPQSVAADMDPAKVIRENQIICLECGQSFKLLTKKHLAVHGLSPEEYRERHGYRKNTPLVCKALQRERRKKMKSMKLWERKRTHTSQS